MKKTLLLVLTVMNVTLAKSQLTVDTSLTPVQWVQNVLVGSGLAVSNITYTGSVSASGMFYDSTSSIGFSSGVILTTGKAQNAIGPNNSSSVSFSNSLSGDTDIDIVMSPTPSFDASVLEFDIIPSGDTVIFRYSFGSDEYMEFAGGPFNDAFGFFVSGPGISGPYTNSAENIALIPGTTTPVSINNVDLLSNSQYYFDNGNGSGNGTAPDGTIIQYDGYTTPLDGILIAQIGQTYHVKIVVADGSDGVFDSGVFLEGFGLSSHMLQVNVPNLLTNANVSICPNPFTSQTTIIFNEKGEHIVKLTDVLGNIVQQFITNNEELLLDMNGFAKGIYFVRIVGSESSSSNEVNRKIIYN